MAWTTARRSSSSAPASTSPRNANAALRPANPRASPRNLYPDARPCLTALREQGLLVGLAGNQTARAETILMALNFDVDVIGTSDGWGVEKPSAGFFDRVVVEAGCPADQVLYVGDRLDNDVKPAQEAGLATGLIRRGPWGYILADPAVSGRCLFHIESLAELPDLVRKHNAS